MVILLAVIVFLISHVPKYKKLLPSVKSSFLYLEKYYSGLTRLLMTPLAGISQKGFWVSSF